MITLVDYLFTVITTIINDYGLFLFVSTANGYVRLAPVLLFVICAGIILSFLRRMSKE